MSSFSINTLVQKKLEREYPVNSISGAIPMGRSTTGRKEWNYLFASCLIVPNMKKWLDVITELPNRLNSILLLPIEAAKFTSTLEANFAPKTKERPLWKIFVSHNKVGGLRQIAYKGDEMVLTRLINMNDEKFSDVIAGNIEQELLNSLEYLKRVSFRETDDYEVYVIVSQDIKKHLQSSKLVIKHMISMTPHEVGIKLEMKNATFADDRFSDVVIAMHIAQQPKYVLPLHTKDSRMLLWMGRLNGLVKVLFYVTIPFVLFSVLSTLWDVEQISMELSDSVKVRNDVAAQWNNIKNSAEYSKDEELKITQVVSLYKILSGSNISPIMLFLRFMYVKGDNVLVNNVKWTRAQEYGDDVGKMQISQTGAGGQLYMSSSDANRNTYQVTCVFNVDFYSPGGGYQSMFNEFDLFIKRVKARFKGYVVEHSGMTGSISFDQDNKVIPIQITFKGPVDDKLESNKQPQGTASAAN
jgi:hypothetical protein